MSIDDIKDLTRRLMSDHTLGWADDPKLLAKVLGFTYVYVLKNRLSGKIRMTLPEQIFASDALGRILRGEIICERRLFEGKIVGYVLAVRNPKPLGWKPGVRCQIGLTSRGVKLSVCPS